MLQFLKSLVHRAATPKVDLSRSRAVEVLVVYEEDSLPGIPQTLIWHTLDCPESGAYAQAFYESVADVPGVTILEAYSVQRDPSKYH